MEQGPEQDASAKLAQHLAVAVQVAEAVIRLRQQQLENRAAATEQAAAAARAERTAQHAADRITWTPGLDRDWTGTADLPDLGRVWGAAAGWADTDPVADVAATRVETRLAQMAPAAMARYDELRTTGVDRLDAMRDVLTHLAAETRAQEPIVMGAGPTTAAGEGWARVDMAGSTVVGASVDDRIDRSDRTTVIPDQRRTFPADRGDRVPAAATEAAATDRQVAYIVDLLDRSPRRTGRAGDGPTDPVEIAALSRAAASEYIQALGGGPTPHRVTAAGHPHPVDVAADSYPHPYTRVTPTTTGRTPAPATGAATRSTTRTLSR